MPQSEEYKGHGPEVMESMKKTYGDRAENVYYATINKHPEFKALAAKRKKKGK